MINIAKDNVIVNGVHQTSKEKLYVTPPSPVKERLEWFSDMKLGLMIHWGLYNQIGSIASWGLVDSTSEWSRMKNQYGDRLDWDEEGTKLRKEYFDLIHSFNPIRFNPEEWAEFAKENCFKYLLLTTKHHDGFCLWDTKETDFKVTSENCPFHTHKNSDIVKSMFNAFRNKGLGIGAYFSKPDFHNENYWEKEISENGFTDRIPTYDINEKPEKWKAFTNFTHNQMEELISEYGKIDILWLDGGQVCDRWGYGIEIDKITDKLRKYNPELIVVDRTAQRKNEDYLTPELKIPDEVMSVPWESCMTLGDNFHYIYDDDYKSSSEIITMILEIVSKGGNLALNISPQPDGRIPKNAVLSIQELGKWLNKYGEAIFKTRVCAPYKKNNVFYTQTADCIYAISHNCMPDVLYCNEKISKAEHLNSSQTLNYTQTEAYIRLEAIESTEEFNIFKLYKAEG